MEAITAPATNGDGTTDGRKNGRLGTLEKQVAAQADRIETLERQVKMLLDERAEARKQLAQQLMANPDVQQHLLTATPEDRQKILDEIARLTNP